MRTGTTIILVFVLLMGCEQTTDIPEETELYPDLGLTREDSLEAEIIAYFLDQSLTANDSTLERELYLLNMLRQTFRDSFPFIDELRFFPPWEPNVLIVGAEDSILQEIKNDTFQDWGDIEQDMRPDSVGPIRWGYTLFYFERGYHPVLLSEIYEELPGIEWAEENAYGWIGQPYFPLVIHRSDSANVYLFSQYGGFDQEPHPHYLFNYVEDQPNYLGSSAQMSNDEYSGYINRFANIGYP